MTAHAVAADQRLKAPVLHAVNNRKLVTRPNEAETIYRLSDGEIDHRFKFEHLLIEAHSTSLILTLACLLVVV